MVLVCYDRTVTDPADACAAELTEDDYGCSVALHILPQTATGTPFVLLVCMGAHSAVPLAACVDGSYTFWIVVPRDNSLA